MYNNLPLRRIYSSVLNYITIYNPDNWSFEEKNAIVICSTYHRRHDVYFLCYIQSYLVIPFPNVLRLIILLLFEIKDKCQLPVCSHKTKSHFFFCLY